MKIVHIVNPITPREGSDLAIAQPVTLASLKRARQSTDSNIQVTQLSAQFFEDRVIIPDWMVATEDLTASSLDHPEFQDKRKLPRLSEIWDRLLEHSLDADVVIYSNIDIAVQPDFYNRVAQWMDGQYDAVSVTRRTIPSSYSAPEQLDQMYAEEGELHPGDDCFIVRRDCAERFRIGPVYLGAAYFDKVLLINCAAVCEHFQRLKHERVTFHIGDDQAWFNPKTRTVAMWNREIVRELVAKLEDEKGRLFRIPTIWPYVQSIYRQIGFTTSLAFRWQQLVQAQIGRVMRRLRPGA